MTVLSRSAASARISSTYHSTTASILISRTPTTTQTSIFLSSNITTPTRAHQVRHATFLPRPKRPYTFTQLVRLSDGSVYTHRTTSPIPLYTSQKDARNTLLWNPSSEALAGVESDTAGRLAAFRQRFGRGWDAQDGASEEVRAEGEELEEGYRQEQADKTAAGEAGEGGAGGNGGGLMDLISEASDEQTGAGKSKIVQGAIKKQRDTGKRRR